MDLKTIYAETIPMTLILWVECCLGPIFLRLSVISYYSTVRKNELERKDVSFDWKEANREVVLSFWHCGLGVLKEHRLVSDHDDVSLLTPSMSPRYVHGVLKTKHGNIKNHFYRD